MIATNIRNARNGIESRNNELLTCINLRNRLDSSFGLYLLSQLLASKTQLELREISPKMQQRNRYSTEAPYLRTFLELSSKCLVKIEYFIVLKERS